MTAPERACTVEMAHPSCTLCERAAADAKSLARAVGSRTVTCTDERVGLTHSATITWGAR